MSYKVNPKTKGSGIICAIPQKGTCPVKCKDCFFQSGRSYLEPLKDNLPNMPTLKMAKNRVVRVNDGNDSSHMIDEVISATSKYEMKFFNTSNPTALDKFDDPVVLTINPGDLTDIGWNDIEVNKNKKNNLMFVRVRANTWNTEVVDQAITYYTEKEIPVVLTFMAYFDEESIPKENRDDYMFRKRTTNSYYAITTDAFERIMEKYKYNIWVYSCGKLEGEKGKTSCHRCGNCLREYFYTKEKMENE